MTDTTKILVILIMKGFSIKVVVIVVVWCFVVVLTEEHNCDTMQIVFYIFL